MADAARVLAVGVAVAVALGVAAAVLLPEGPGRQAFPAAGSLAPLAPYLEPVDPDEVRAAARALPATVVVRGDPFRVAAAPRPRPDPDAGPVGPREPPRPRWTLSAILVAGDRTVAIINDQVVRRGDRLRDGAEVAAVGAEHVILITPAGERRRLELER